MTSPIDAAGYNTYATAYANAANANAAVASTANTAPPTGTTDTSNLLDPQAFLQLLVAQLQYQDPTSPADMSAFMTQTATLSQTQSINSMQQAMDSLLQIEQAQTATSMLGKQVTYTDDAGNSYSGIATGATSLASGAEVQVGSVTVPLDDIVAVSEPSWTL